MIMKLTTNTYKLLGLLILLSLAACQKDYLDRPSEDQVEAPYFFNTAKDLEVATNDFYTFLPNESWYTNDGNSDNMIPLTVADRIKGNRTVPVGSGSGGWSWSQLRKINYFLANYHKVPDAVAQKKYGGIARFFRANFYYDKVKTFGDVPWYGKVLSAKDEDLFKARDTRQLVMDSIMADLDYAIENIPAEKQLNLITKYTALLLKARVALFEGTFRKYHQIAGHEKLLNEAVSASTELMNSGAYTLYSQGGADQAYRNLFARNNQDQVETILSIDFELGMRVHGLGYSFTSATSGAYGIAKDMINSYLMKDGSRFTDRSGYKTMEFYQEMQNRDPRLTQTTAGPDFRANGETANEPVNLTITTTGYRLIKALPDKLQWGVSASYFDVILFRYAEALLINAEAKAKLRTISQSDLDLTVNKLRSRAGMPMLSLAEANANPDPYLLAMYPNVDGGAFRGVLLEIRRERRIELFNEGQRWDDLMRWKAGSKLNQPIVGVYFPGIGAYDFTGDGKADVYVHTGNTSGAPGTVTTLININQRTLWDPVSNTQNANKGSLDPFYQRGKFDEKRDYYAPIPIEDIKLNPNLKQNPEWEKLYR